MAAADLTRAEEFEQLVDHVLVASRALVGIEARSLAGVSPVTLPQYRALVVLASRKPVTINDLADALDVHPTTATRLVTRLCVRGLAERRGSPTDGRVVEVHLTRAGRRLVERVTARRRRELAAIVTRMTPDDRMLARRAFAAFAAAAGDPDDLSGRRMPGR